MADADGSLGSNHPTVRSRVEMLTDDTPAPSQRRAPVARSPIRISGAPARMTADGTNVAKPEIVMRSRTSKPAVGPGDHNYMDPDEAELFFLPESKAYPTEMPSQVTYTRHGRSSNLLVDLNIFKYFDVLNLVRAGRSKYFGDLNLASSIF